ncbi:MAG: cysteine hydrolase family protein [Faecalibacillus sp.]
MKKLLIVVDYQNDFVDGSLGFEGAELLDDYISQLIDFYHRNNDDVIFTFDTHDSHYLQSQEGRNLPIVHCLKNSDGWKLYGKTGKKINQNDHCIYKNGFGSLELGNDLKEKNYCQIRIVGIVSNICVLSNAIICKAALPEAEIIIDTKGIGSNDLDMQKKALDVLKNLQFQII